MINKLVNQNQNRSDKNALLSYDNKTKSSQNDNTKRNEGKSAGRKTKNSANINTNQTQDKKFKKKLNNINESNNSNNAENLIKFDQEPENSNLDNSLDFESIKLSTKDNNLSSSKENLICEHDSDDSMINPNFVKNEPETSQLELKKSKSSVAIDLEKSVEREMTKEDDHCHVKKNDKKRNVTVWRKLITVLIMCIFFMIAEIVGGILAHSISIQTDAAHMAADIAGFFFSIMAIYISGKAPTRRMSFGFYRSEVLGALLSTMVIWILTAVLVYLAILRIINDDFEIEPIAMVATAACGVVFNIVMYFVLHTNKCFGDGVELKHHGHSHNSGDIHGHGHSHSHDDAEDHGHSHAINDSNVLEVSIQDESTIDDNSNINLRAAAIHVIGDFIQSVGVLIAALIIYFKPEYKIADPICTFIFSGLVMATTVPIVKDIYFVLMEALPPHLNYDDIINDLCAIENVKRAHSLHIWCLTMEKFALSVHLVAGPNVNYQQILKQANSLLRKKYKIESTTLQIEEYDDLMESCNDCKLPE